MAKGLYLTKQRFDTGFDEEMEDYRLKVQLQQKIAFKDNIEEEFKKQHFIEKQKKNLQNEVKPATAHISIEKMKREIDQEESKIDNFLSQNQSTGHASSLKRQSTQVVQGKQKNSINMKLETKGKSNSNLMNELAENDSSEK